MKQLSDLVAIVAATRIKMADDEALERDRRSGLEALRPSIDYLQANARSQLEDMKTAMEPVGVVVEIDEGWNDLHRTKRAALLLGCRAGAGWPGRVLGVQGVRIILSCTAQTISLATRPFQDRDGSGEALLCNPGQEVALAIEHAISTFLDAASRPAVMRGAELRIVSGR